jgi:hypothetical protein
MPLLAWQSGRCFTSAGRVWQRVLQLPVSRHGLLIPHTRLPFTSTGVWSLPMAPVNLVRRFESGTIIDLISPSPSPPPQQQLATSQAKAQKPKKSRKPTNDESDSDVVFVGETMARPKGMKRKAAISPPDDECDSDTIVVASKSRHVDRPALINVQPSHLNKRRRIVHYVSVSPL